VVSPTPVTLWPASFNTSIEDEVVESSAPEPELNSGLVLLAEKYEKQSQQKLFLSRIFRWLAGIILVVAVVSFAAVSGYVWSGIAVAVVAVVFLIVSRMASSQAREIENIAAALVTTEDTL
jgi:Flp pilus assembly protein TadB